jgi:hypothetical protein
MGAAVRARFSFVHAAMSMALSLLTKCDDNAQRSKTVLLHIDVSLRLYDVFIIHLDDWKEGWMSFFTK